MSFQKSGLLIFFLSMLIGACGSTQQITESDEILSNKTTQATLWVQNASEYSAITTQVYNTAQRKLPLSLEDSFWTASLSQQKNENHLSLPPAVILDIDETVLDNSPFQARMIKQNKTFNIEDWNAWCNEANADAISGAVEFTNYAAENGVTIFYISNRSYEVEDATRKNLIEKGFPVSDSIDTIMSNGEKPDWNSSKVERRKVVEEGYRILMAFGDDLNDFLPAKDITLDRRAALVEQNNNKFGRMWFVLPNPVYGSWEDALFDFEDDLTEIERNNTLQKRLDTKTDY